MNSIDGTASVSLPSDTCDCWHGFDAIAERMAQRLELAVVESVPRALLDMMTDPCEWIWSVPAAQHSGGDQVRFSRRGDVLEIRFVAWDSTTIATFRYCATVPK